MISLSFDSDTNGTFHWPISFKAQLKTQKLLGWMSQVTKVWLFILDYYSRFLLLLKREPLMRNPPQKTKTGLIWLPICSDFETLALQFDSRACACLLPPFLSRSVKLQAKIFINSQGRIHHTAAFWFDLSDLIALFLYEVKIFLVGTDTVGSKYKILAPYFGWQSQPFSYTMISCINSFSLGNSDPQQHEKLQHIW